MNKLAGSCILTAAVAVGSFFLTAPLKAQVTNEIIANISHSFTVGETTLPPGRYEFRMVQDADLQVMTVTSEAGNTSEEFLVRESDLNRTPNHSELVFDRIGNREFLTKIYEAGTQIGVAIDQPSRIKQRMVKQGQRAMEHAEALQP
jgi:hypothetical protein